LYSSSSLHHQGTESESLWTQIWSSFTNSSGSSTSTTSTAVAGGSTTNVKGMETESQKESQKEHEKKEEEEVMPGMYETTDSLMFYGGELEPHLVSAADYFNKQFADTLFGIVERHEPLVLMIGMRHLLHSPCLLYMRNINCRNF
jgi:hypothetical protein